MDWADYFRLRSTGLAVASASQAHHYSVHNYLSNIYLRLALPRIHVGGYFGDSIVVKDERGVLGKLSAWHL